MRRLTYAIVICGVFAAEPYHAAAGLRSTPASVDLGEILGGTPRQQRFVLHNDGAAPIEIVEVERGCGCLQVRLDRRIVPPGGAVSLLVEFRTSGQPNGRRSWNLRVRYRDGAEVREALLVLAGTIRNEVTVEPSILALYVRNTLRQQVVITDRRSPPLKVTALHVTSPAVVAKVQSAQAGVTKLVLEVSSAGLTRDREDAVLNVYTDDPRYNPLQLPITLARERIAAAIAVPPRVETHVSAGQPVTATLVRLRRTDGKPAVVTAAESDAPGIACTWAAGPGDAATLKIQVDLRRLRKSDNAATVRVRMADEALTIPVRIERDE